MDPNDENPSSLPLDNANFMSVDTISIKDNSPQELIQCILEHEVAGTPLVLTGLNSGTSWPSVIPHFLGRSGLTIEGWDPARPCVTCQAT